MLPVSVVFQRLNVASTRFVLLKQLKLRMRRMPYAENCPGRCLGSLGCSYGPALRAAAFPFEQDSSSWQPGSSLDVFMLFLSSATFSSWAIWPAGRWTAWTTHYKDLFSACIAKPFPEMQFDLFLLILLIVDAQISQQSKTLRTQHKHVLNFFASKHLRK